MVKPSIRFKPCGNISRKICCNKTPSLLSSRKETQNYSVQHRWSLGCFFLDLGTTILLFQYKDGQPTSSEDTSCIQVFHKKWYVSLITVCIAYYVPVLVMTILYIKICFLIIKQRQKFSTTKYAITCSKNLDCCCCGVNYDYSHDSILPNKKTVHLQSSLDKSYNLCIIPQTQFNRPEVCDIMPQEIECSPTSQTPELKCQKFKLQEMREQWHCWFLFYLLLQLPGSLTSYFR